jgi:hypothetical protein
MRADSKLEKLRGESLFNQEVSEIEFDKIQDGASRQLENKKSAKTKVKISIFTKISRPLLICCHYVNRKSDAAYTS